MKQTLLLFSGDIILQNRLAQAAQPLGAAVKAVKAADYTQPVGRLAGDELLPAAAEPYRGAPFAKPLLVICGFTRPQLDVLLDVLRARQIDIEYKAMLTPTNRNWTAAALYAEIAREHAEMNRSAGAGR